MHVETLWVVGKSEQAHVKKLYTSTGSALHERTMTNKIYPIMR